MGLMHTRTSRSVAISRDMVEIILELLKQQRGARVPSDLPPNARSHDVIVPGLAGRSDAEQPRHPWLAPALLGCLALAVRLPHFDHVAHFDELYHFLAAQSWLAEGQLRVAEGIYDRTPLFTIFLAQWLGLFGENLVVARLPSLIAGTALVVLVYLWTRAVAGSLAAALAALLLALDPEHLQISQWGRFYAIHCLTFWLGAVGTYRLALSPPPTLGRTILLAAGVVICFGTALYLQITTLIGLLAIAVWSTLAVALPWLSRLPPRTRWGIVAGAALVGAAAIWLFVETGLVAELLARYRSTTLRQAGNSDEFWYYHWFLTIYYPTLWPLVALAVVIGLAYRPRPTAFCACVVAIAFVAHSFAAAKSLRYLTYVAPFLFVLWGIALAEVWPRLWRFLEEAGTRALAWLHLGRLGRGGVVALLAVVLVFTTVANGALVRTAAAMFGFVIPPMQTPPDWAAAKDPLAPWLADAGIVLTTDELSALYYLGRYDVLISRTRMGDYGGNWGEFSIDPRTGRPVIGRAESLALIMDCSPTGLIVADAGRWRNPLQLDDAVADLVEARAEEVELSATAIRAYVWRQPDGARRAQACADLPAGMADGGADGVMPGLEPGHAQ
jgi:4-amino-4-deoxy-L-arabinose transferase-like glycosyltransferase